MPRQRTGFTLLEMLLATALTAVLMAGVLAVVVRVMTPIPGGVSRSGGAEPATVVDAEAYVRLLQADLSRCTSVLTRDGVAVELIGYGGLNALQYQRTQRPVRVRYEVATNEGDSWLIRQELPLDTDEEDIVRRDLVGMHVTRIELVPPAVRDDESDGPAAAEAEDEGDATETEPPTHEAWRLRVWTGVDETPAIDRAVLLRRGVAG